MNDRHCNLPENLGFIITYLHNNYILEKWIQAIMIDKNATINVKAIAIMMVLFGHLVGAKRTELSGAWEIIATCGVALFLFISGYGLYKSFESKGFQGFWVSKFKKIYVPFVIATFFVGGSRGFWGDRWSEMLETVLFLNLKLTVDGTMWYIYYIVIWYFAFYLIFGLLKTNLLRLMVLAALSFVLFNIPEQLSDTYRIAIPLFRWHAFSFTIGVAVAMLKPIKRSWLLILGCILFLIFSYLLSRYLFNRELLVATVTISAPAIIFIVSALNIHIKPLAFIGGLSYELYLFEGAFRWNTFSPDKFSSGVIFFLITLSCAYLLKVSLKNIKALN